MKKYPISLEFFPFSLFTPPINEKFLALASANMKIPGAIWKHPEVRVSMKEIESYDREKVSFVFMEPKKLSGDAPCLIYIHGGGFVLEAAGYHYRNALRYAMEAGCKVVFPLYRLAPKYPFPVFYEDCYAVFEHVYDHVKDYGIDSLRFAVGGDSAGSALSAGLCLMARDRKHPVRFRCQMLPYPFLDARNNSESCRKYTDTPMWNSTLSTKIAPMTKVSQKDPGYVYYSPVEADDLAQMPPAYIETAEFDCLHDDGILYAKLLQNSGVSVELNETRGTMHGYDIMEKSKIAKDSMEKRIAFLKKWL